MQAFVGERPALCLSRDQFGNLLIEMKARRTADRPDKKPPRWVFAAHMDHPGFVADRMRKDGRLAAFFRGGVDAAFFPEARVKFFDGDDEVLAVVERYQTRAAGRPAAAILKIDRPIPPGTLGMWDQGIGRAQSGKFFSRACDDLAGAAAALAMLDALCDAPRTQAPKVDVAVLLTRAEEEGFIGAIAAATRPKLLRKSDRLIAIECSAQQPFAPQGNGAIIRVGDRTSIFNSALTYFLTQTATDLAKADKSFKFQRALMPGGTCEATVYDAWGFTAASICVPLGNYHNMDKAAGKIAPEFIDLGDWDSMVRLFIELARQGHAFTPGHGALKKRVLTRFDAFRHLL